MFSKNLPKSLPHSVKHDMSTMIILHVTMFQPLYTQVSLEVNTKLLNIATISRPTSFPGLFPFELGRREKTLASAGHVPILHPKILGVIN